MALTLAVIKPGGFGAESPHVALVTGTAASLEARREEAGFDLAPKRRLIYMFFTYSVRLLSGVLSTLIRKLSLRGRT